MAVARAATHAIGRPGGGRRCYASHSTFHRAPVEQAWDHYRLPTGCNLTPENNCP